MSRLQDLIEKERVRFRNLLSEYAGDKIGFFPTYCIGYRKAIADEVLLMKKKENFILQEYCSRVDSQGKW